MTKKGRPVILHGKLKIFSPPGPTLALNDLGGLRTKTKFTKWSVSLRTWLRTAGLDDSFGLSFETLNFRHYCSYNAHSRQHHGLSFRKIRISSEMQLNCVGRGGALVETMIFQPGGSRVRLPL